MSSLDLSKLRPINVERATIWHNGDMNEWSTLEWAGAMCGEAGEATNIAKKIRRVDLAIKSARNEPRDVLRSKLTDEIADTLIYLDLLAARENIDLARAVILRFNAVSEREGMQQRLSFTTGCPDCGYGHPLDGVWIKPGSTTATAREVSNVSTIDRRPCAADREGRD